MRVLPFACLLLTLSAPAMAEDRYGPQNPTAMNAAPSNAAPSAAMPSVRLSWHGKVEPSAPAADLDASAPMRPLADGALRRTGAYGQPLPVMPAPAMAAPPPAPAQQTANPAPQAENAPWKRLMGPAPAPAATNTMADAPAPAVTVPASPPAPQTQLAARPAAAAGDQARYYSLHREYGETPDAIPAPQKTQVFLDGGPLNAGVGDGDAVETDSTGKTAANNKARIAADWRASAAP